MRKRLREARVRKEERSRGIAASASEACSNGNPLFDRDEPAGLDAGRGGEAVERGADETVLREAFDAETRRRLEPDPVGEGHPLKDRRDLVEPVWPAFADDEREVDLRVRLRGA